MSRSSTKKTDAKAGQLINRVIDLGGFVYVRLMGQGRAQVIVERHHGSNWLTRRENCDVETLSETIIMVCKDILPKKPKKKRKGKK